MRIYDLFARLDWKTGRVRLDVTVRNATEAERLGEVRACVAPAAGGGAQPSLARPSVSVVRFAEQSTRSRRKRAHGAS